LRDVLSSEHGIGLGIVNLNKPEAMIMDRTQATEPLIATCQQTLQHLDEIETKLAALFDVIENHAKLVDVSG
jgi:hypothetical protein